MAYTNFQHCTEQEYTQIIYSQGADNKLKILFNGVELEDADRYCEKLTLKSRILPDDSSKRLSLDNFVSKEAELILHRIDESVIQDQVEISIGTLVDDENEIYEYVPLGIFNIQDTPTTDKDKITVKLRDNRVKFDFNYNAKPLIDENDGIVTKLQILQDICEKAEVETDIEEFLGSEDTLSIYDNTITATTYISYLAEQAGCIASIDRLGKLIFVDLSNVSTNRVPLSIVEKYEKGIPFKIERVVYEDGIRKYETSNDKSLNTLYLNSANPYISSQQQINNIYSLLNNFLIDSVETGKILGNPAIDSYDLIEVYDDYENNETIFKTLANHTLTYNGVLISQYKTQIGLEQRTENVTINGEPTFRKWAKTNIDNVNAEITIQAGQIQETQNNLENNYYNKSSVDTLIINSATGVTNTFSEAGGNNVFRNTGLWFGPDTTTEEKEASSTNGKIEIDDGADNTLSNLKIYGNTLQDGTPTSDTPVEIQNVTGLQNINVCGKNLFDKTRIISRKRLDNKGLPSISDNSYCTTDYFIAIEPNTTYYSSALICMSKAVCFYDSNQNFIERVMYTQTNTFTTGSTTHYIKMSILLSEIDTQQLEKGNQATTYEPYIGNSYPIPLGNIELCKIGTYQDYIYKSNGTWYKHKVIGKVILNGTEDWNNDGGTIGTDYRHNIQVSKLNIGTPINTNYLYKSNYFYAINIGRNNAELGGFYLSSSWLVFDDKNATISSTNNWKTWLSTHNTIVYYVLATPTTEEITDTELINQLNSIKTIDGYNLILLASNDVDTEFDITYLIDFTSYEYWTGDLGKIKEEKAANLNALLLQHGEVYQEQQVPNGNYTISFKYKKLINLANVKCIINDVEYELTEDEATEFTQTIEVKSQTIKVKFECDTDEACEIYDLMVNAGKVKLAYSQNQNETTTDTVNISKGITITSTDTDTTFKANADGIRTLDRNGNVLTKFTDTGMTTKEMIVEDTSQIVGVLVQQVGDQTWFTRL